MIFFFSLIVLFLSILNIICFNKNLLQFLLSLEVSFLSLIFMFLYSSFVLDDIGGQFTVLIILTVAAMESAFGLALVIYIYHLFNTITFNQKYVIG